MDEEPFRREFILHGYVANGMRFEALIVKRLDFDLREVKIFDADKRLTATQKICSDQFRTEAEAERAARECAEFLTTRRR